MLRQRDRKEVPWFKLFKQFESLDGADTLVEKWRPTKKDKEAGLIPRIDPHYVFPLIETQVLVNVLSLQQNNPVWIRGWSGTGKSALLRQVCARLRAPLYEIEGSSALTLRSMLGTTAASEGRTFFQERTLLQWLRNGGVLGIHEYDTLEPSVVNALKPIMECPPHYAVPEINERVIGHPDCRVVVTCNTWGNGDSSGLFGANTHRQSDADLRRFTAFIELDYLPEAVETAMLGGVFDVTTEGDLAQLQQVVQYANAVRGTFKKGESSFTLSPAQLITWVRLTLRLGCGFRRAADFAFLNKLDAPTKEAAIQLLDAVYPSNTTSSVP